MDPLSTLASIFTLCDWAFKVLRVFKTAHNAPKEIKNLVDEVSGLKAVIGWAASVIQDPHLRHGLDSSQLSGLSAAIDDVNSKLHDLCKTVEHCSRKTGTGRFLLLRRINKIKSQRLELNDAKLNLIIALEAINLFMFETCMLSPAPLETMLSAADSSTQLSVGTPSTAHHFNFFQGLVVAGNDRLNFDQSVVASTARIIGGIAVESHYPGASRQTNIAPTAHPIEQIEDSRPTGSDSDWPLVSPNETIALGHFGHADSAQGQRPDGVTTVISAKCDGTETHTNSAAGDRCPTILSSQQPWRNGCPLLACSCICHQRHWKSTPSVFNYIFGSARGGFYGLYRHPCNERSCARQRTKAAWISYRFPSYVFLGMISFSISGSPLYGRRLGLSFPRIVKSGAKIFLYAKTGNVDGLRELLQHGKASPGDIQYNTGYIALSIAIIHHQMDAIKLLLAAKADPYIEDRLGGTPFDIAWDYIHTKHGNPTSDDTLRGLFSDTQQLERCRFSPLHRIVLQLATTPLEPTLALSTSGIDLTDRGGRTALSWAVERGDTEAVRTLLQYGANPNIADGLGIAPLVYACSCTRIRALMAWGMDAYASDGTASPSAVLPAVAPGSSINHTIVRLLLQHGADHTTGTRATCGRGLLHVAAYLADQALLDILADFGLHDLDMEERDKFGYTPIELLRTRSDLGDEQIESFERRLERFGKAST